MNVNEAHTQTTELGYAFTDQLPERATTLCSCGFVFWVFF